MPVPWLVYGVFLFHHVAPGNQSQLVQPWWQAHSPTVSSHHLPGLGVSFHNLNILKYLEALSQNEHQLGLLAKTTKKQNSDNI